MTIKAGFRGALWMVPGVAFLLLLCLLVFHYYRGQDTAAQIASQAKKVKLVVGMRLDLASASVAEKSAVIAVVDKDSQTFADQARAATAVVEQKYRELAKLLSNDGTPHERDLLSRFEKAFREFQRIDDELLSLAVKNTNIKAFNLAFGPAAEAVRDMDIALSHVVAEGSGLREARLVCDARIGALRIQALLAPHIVEKSDQRMDELEAQIKKEDQRVEKALAELRQLSARRSLDAAAASYARFCELRAQILALSRENTNVRSVAIALDQDTKVMLTCQDMLTALQQAIEKDPIAGLTYGRPARPR